MPRLTDNDVAGDDFGGWHRQRFPVAAVAAAAVGGGDVRTTACDKVDGDAEKSPTKTRTEHRRMTDADDDDGAGDGNDAYRTTTTCYRWRHLAMEKTYCST